MSKAKYNDYGGIKKEGFLAFFRGRNHGTAVGLREGFSRRAQRYGSACFLKEFGK
jgi:hypothetical protein